MIYTVRNHGPSLRSSRTCEDWPRHFDWSQTLDNFYLTAEQLEDSPSRQDGVTADDETRARVYGCEIIQEAGMLLRLPQVTMATGQVLLHRFYCKQSLVKRDVKVGDPSQSMLMRSCLAWKGD